LGLPLVDRLAVVVAGSWGVGDIDDTVRDLAAAGTVTPVVVCGHNESLRRRLARTGPGIVRGWIDDMPSLLRAADVVVHNAGALSCLEALATGVPVISYRCLPGHGVANAAALRIEGLSAWPRSPGALAQALRYALDGDLCRRQSTAFAAVSAAPDAADVVAALANRSAPERASIGVMA
jgi:UDP-N-acetylglucosamine:LPS N-acetylglucosamine transferase